MGDKWAPAIAQVSHEAVLKASGALDEHEHLRNLGTRSRTHP